MLKNKEYEIYNNIIKNIVKNSGGFREKKVLNIIEKNTLDHKNGFSVYIVTRKICG